MRTARGPGVSLSAELSSLAEFRIYASKKLLLIEKLVSGINSVVDGSEPATPLVKGDPTKRCKTDHDPAVTKHCLLLLITSNRPLTIGEICSGLESYVDLAAMCKDPLRLVCESLQQLACAALAMPVEPRGVRKWVWVDAESAEWDELAERKGIKGKDGL
jgi:hypothetical protein